MTREERGFWLDLSFFFLNSDAFLRRFAATLGSFSSLTRRSLVKISGFRVSLKFLKRVDIFCDYRAKFTNKIQIYGLTKESKSNETSFPN